MKPESTSEPVAGANCIEAFAVALAAYRGAALLDDYYIEISPESFAHHLAALNAVREAATAALEFLLPMNDRNSSNEVIATLRAIANGDVTKLNGTGPNTFHLYQAVLALGRTEKQPHDDLAL